MEARRVHVPQEAPAKSSSSVWRDLPNHSSWGAEQQRQPIRNEVEAGDAYLAFLFACVCVCECVCVCVWVCVTCM